MIHLGWPTRSHSCSWPSHHPRPNPLDTDPRLPPHSPHHPKFQRHASVYHIPKAHASLGSTFAISSPRLSPRASRPHPVPPPNPPRHTPHFSFFDRSIQRQLPHLPQFLRSCAKFFRARSLFQQRCVSLLLASPACRRYTPAGAHHGRQHLALSSIMCSRYTSHARPPPPVLKLHL